MTLASNRKSLFSWLDRTNRLVPLEVADSAARKLTNAARALSRISEQECNGIERWDANLRRYVGSWTDEDQARADKLRVRHEQKAVAAWDGLGQPGFKLVFQGDPRGAPFCVMPADADPNHSGRAFLYFS